MTWLGALAATAAALAAMRAAAERGDLDEAARRGALAGPVVVERALASPDHATRLAGIAASTIVEDRAELLAGLARLAAGTDRSTALPAAAAARAIALELARRDRLDDLAPDDIATWRAAWADLALHGDRPIELRLAALDAAAALDTPRLAAPAASASTAATATAGAGVDLATALADADPVFRRAAAAIVPLPAPPATHAALAAAVSHDEDPMTALTAAQSLCLSLDASRAGILAALGADGVARLRTLIAHPPAGAGPLVRDATRCVVAAAPGKRR